MSVAHRIYARALYDAARPKGREHLVDEQLAEFVGATHDVPELGVMLANPQLDSRAKADVVAAVLGDADELVRNFVLLLIEKWRIGELEEVGREYHDLAREAVLRVELTTAMPLGEDEVQALVDQIGRATGRRVETTQHVDPDLIGGVVLRVGSLRLDASVRG